MTYSMYPSLSVSFDSGVGGMFSVVWVIECHLCFLTELVKVQVSAWKKSKGFKINALSSFHDYPKLFLGSSPKTNSISLQLEKDHSHFEKLILPGSGAQSLFINNHLNHSHTYKHT